MRESASLTIALSPGFPSDCAHLLQDVSPHLRLVQLQAEGQQPAEAGEAEVLAWWSSSRELLASCVARMPRLRWVQSPMAGVGDKKLHEILGPNVVLTSAAGVYADLIAEHVLALVLALYRRLPELLEQQGAGHWHDLDTRSLSGDTIGIVGAGGIGRATARLAHAFNMHTIGIRRGDEPVPELDQTLRANELLALLAAADVVVIAAPLTDETRGMVDARFLRAMKTTALLINVARGKIVVTDALLQALREGWIAGAGLDVTDPEPLPPDHPLWHAPNTIITPHHANPDQASNEPAVRRFAKNLRRYLAGEPLIAVVDPQRGY